MRNLFGVGLLVCFIVLLGSLSTGYKSRKNKKNCASLRYYKHMHSSSEKNSFNSDMCVYSKCNIHWNKRTILWRRQMSCKKNSLAILSASQKKTAKCMCIFMNVGRSLQSCSSLLIVPTSHASSGKFSRTSCCQDNPSWASSYRVVLTFPGLKKECQYHNEAMGPWGSSLNPQLLLNKC